MSTFLQMFVAAFLGAAVNDMLRGMARHSPRLMAWLRKDFP